MTSISITSIVAQARDYPRGGSYREFDAKPRMYFFVEGENLLENFANRFDRPSKLYRQFVPQVLEQLGLDPGTKVIWSQKAGCSCGCSPAFIVQADPRVTGNRIHETGQLVSWQTVDGERKRAEAEHARPCDIYITIKGEDAKVKDDADNDRRAGRADALLSDPTIVGALQATKVEIQTGRSGSGNLRNFKQMSDDKFYAVAADIRSEDNDVEAIDAVNAEQERRES